MQYRTSLNLLILYYRVEALLFGVSTGPVPFSCIMQNCVEKQLRLQMKLWPYGQKSYQFFEKRTAHLSMLTVAFIYPYPAVRVRWGG